MPLERYYTGADGLHYVSGDPHDYFDELLTGEVFSSLTEAIADMEGERTEEANNHRKMNNWGCHLACRQSGEDK
jgi:hypothetical protein